MRRPRQCRIFRLSFASGPSSLPSVEAPKEFQPLMDEIFRQKVLRAPRQSPEEKLKDLDDALNVLAVQDGKLDFA
jgi:hypothetical protein